MSHETADVITKTIRISTINAIRIFVDLVSRHKCQSTLISGNNAIDAKALLGILSLDVSEPLTLELEIGRHGIDDRDELIQAIDKYIVKEPAKNEHSMVPC